MFVPSIITRADFPALAGLLADVEAVVDSSPTRRRKADVFNAATRPAPRRPATPPTPAPAPTIVGRRTQVEAQARAEFATGGGAAVLGIDEPSYVRSRLVDENVIDLAGNEVLEPAPPVDNSFEVELAKVQAAQEYYAHGGAEKLNCSLDEYVFAYLCDHRLATL
jgi:hypothetical protein